MKAAVIVARCLDGRRIAGDAGASVADLLPKALALRDAGKVGKTSIDRVWILADAGIVKEHKVATAEPKA